MTAHAARCIKPVYHMHLRMQEVETFLWNFLEAHIECLLQVVAGGCGLEQ
jgi:hypothetical protein